MDEKTKEALYYLAREIGNLSAYIGQLRNEGKYSELVDDEVDARVERVAKIIGDNFLK